MQIEPVGSIVARWGEGPFAENGRVTYVDIEERRVIRLDLETGTETVWPVGQRVGCVLPRRDGLLLCAGDHGFFNLDPVSGACEPLADPEAEIPDNRFNDGKCAPDGRAFAGSISLARKPGSAALYRFDPDGRVERVLDGLTNSNGMAWSAGGDTVYHIDTPRKNVRAFDYRDGCFLKGRVVIDTSSFDGVPDGMTIDSDGRLWVAFCHGGAVVAFDPGSGKALRRIELPCRETTSACFGGPGLETLFVTTGLSRERDEPLAGRLFAVSGLGARGRPVDVFGGRE
jgi:sugar lactone lactonase YvrE